MKYEIDSRKVQPGQTFVAIKGHTVDGHDFINDAIKNGATKIIAEREVKSTVPVEIVANSEEYLKEKLVTLYAPKLASLTIIGLTGTNGKTTSCYLTYQFLKALGLKVAYLGTIGFYFENEEIILENTTPNILTLYNLLLNAKNKGCSHVVMEISSHSLYYERIAGLKLQIAGFTNLTEDHLDFHKTMANYLKEKLKIINYLKPEGTLIVNADDPVASDFLTKWHNNLTFGYHGDFKILDYTFNPAKTTLDFSFHHKNYQTTYNLTSTFNVYNYLTALAICYTLGFSLDALIKVSPLIKAPKGRCETYEINDAFAIIDYAHTPDAVEKIITAYNQIKKKRIITIIGCGGDRDPLKRPIMGNIATTLSDYVIFTNDNPRTEKAENIMNDILKGVKKENYQVIFDRQEAIKKGLDMLTSEDILLILGKGHEDYQIIGHTKHHLSDKEEVLNWLKINQK